MKRLALKIAAWGLTALIILIVPHGADALGLSGLRVKAGVNLTREQQFSNLQGFGGQFDSHRWMLGGNLDLGSLLLPKLHLVPGVDFIVQENVRIYVINVDGAYFFHHSPRGKGYAGAGFGTHLYRPTAAANGTVAASDTKISLNVPIGYQRKLGNGLAWFGEVKLVIADDEKDSALQFSVGFNFGSNE